MSSGSDKLIYRCGDLELDPRSGQARRDGREQYLRPKTLQVLVYLIEQRDRLVTKEELIERVWQGIAVTDDALVQSIVEIRRLLGDNSQQPRFIKTFPKAGYRFIGPVEEVWPPERIQEPLAAGQMIEQLWWGKAEVEEVTSVEIEVADELVEQEARQPEIAAPRRLPPRAARLLKRPVVFLPALALILLPVLGLWLYSKRADDWRLAEITLPRVAGKRSVAVMHFENRSGSRDLDWLREGLADMLIANFSRSPRLSVLSRQQLAVLLDRLGHRRAAQIPLEEALEIASRTQAEVLAVGSFAQLGEKVRLDVQLHDARTGRLLVTESSIADTPAQVLTQVDLLSLKLAGHLGATPPEPDAHHGLSALMTNNLDAYRYYSLALEQAQMFQFTEAIALLEKAIALDPQFAMAHARIGYVYAVKWQQHEKAKPYLAKAFSLAERLSEKDKLFVTAWAAVADNDSARAIAVYREIITRYPLETEAYERLGLSLYRMSQWEEALAVSRQGLVTDPDRKELYNIIGHCSMYLNRREEGLAALNRYVQLAPNDPNAYDGLGSFHQWFGEYEQAAAAFGRALALNPESHVAIIHLGNLYVRQGRYAAALEQYRRYVQVARIDAQRARGYSCQAWVRLRKGELAEAEAASALEKKYATGLVWTPVELALRRGDQAAAARLAAPHLAPAGYEYYKGRGQLRIYHYLRGDFALRTGRAGEAVEHFREAMPHQAAEWNIDSFEDCLANGYLAAGRFDEAIAEYNRILGINPHYPLAHYHLGQAYERKGDRERARVAYERFLQIWKDADPDVPEVIEAKARLAELQH